MFGITREMGKSETADWDMDSILKRDIRISDDIRALLAKWDMDYQNFTTSTVQDDQPSEEDLARIAEFKKKGWI